MLLSADFIWICEENRYEADKCQSGEVNDIVNKKGAVAVRPVPEYRGRPVTHFNEYFRVLQSSVYFFLA